MRRAGHLVLLAAILTACTSPITEVRPTETSATPSRIPSATAALPASEGSPAPLVARSDAWKSDSLAVVSGQVDPDHFLSLTAATWDGRLAIGSVQRTDWVDNRRGVPKEPERIVLVETATSRLRVLRTLPTPGHAMGSTDADDRWLVWTERDSTAPLTDWTLLAYDRQTDRVLELARGPRYPDGRVYPSYILPRVGGGVVVWSEPVPPAAEGSPAGVRVVAMRLPTFELQELTRTGRGAWVSWPYAAWLELQEGRNVIIRANLETGERSTLRARHDAADVAIAGMATAWVDRVGGGLWLAETPYADPVFVARRDSPDNPFQELSLTPRLLGWFSNTLPGVYDRVMKHVVLLEEAGLMYGWSSKVGGQALLWTKRPTKATQSLPQPVRDFEIIDISRL